MKIAVCDGDVKACREIRRMLDRYGEKERVFLETELFSESGALCQEAEAGKRYDLVFLEVRPKNGGGTEAGRRIRQRWKASETRIVYMFSEMVKQEKLRQNEPADLLSKPLQADQIAAVLDRIRMEDQRSGRFYFYRKSKFLYQIPYSEILFFQSAGRKIQIHTRQGIYEYNGKLSEVLERGIPETFIRIHKSYIVNGSCIAGKLQNRIYLQNRGESLSVSQPYRKTLKDFLASDPQR